MKKRFVVPGLLGSLLSGLAAAAAKGVHFQKPLASTYDYVAVSNTIDKVMQVLVAAIIILVLVLVQGLFFFLRDLRQK